MPQLQEQEQQQQQHLRKGRNGQRAEPAPMPAGAAMSRTALASALVCERRRVALRHRRHPTEETRARLAAIDQALAEYKIDIPALEQARSARRSGGGTGAG